MQKPILGSQKNEHVKLFFPFCQNFNLKSLGTCTYIFTCNQSISVFKRITTILLEARIRLNIDSFNIT